MYEGLYDGLQRATHLTMISWIDPMSRDIVQTVERKGQTLWTMRTDCRSLISLDSLAMDMLKDDQLKAAKKIMKEILDEADWDAFWFINRTGQNVVIEGVNDGTDLPSNA